jgi:hypothetical protein
MGKEDAATWGCCNLITYVLLLIFTAVAFGTYSWGVAYYDIENTTTGCTADVIWTAGLERQYRSFDNDCTDDSSNEYSAFNCDNLTDDQCDYLEEAHDSSAVAITCCVILVIIYSLVMLSVKKQSKTIMWILIILSLIVGLILLATAFAATTAYQNLIGKAYACIGDVYLLNLC